MRLAGLLIALLLTLSGCGYHVSGQGDLLPKNIRTIAIPAFTNLTTRYRIAERIPRALGREFISRTRYRVVTDEQDADAVLTGAVINYSAWPNVLDQATGRAAGVQVSVQLQLSLRDRATGKELFSRPGMEFRQRYEISPDQIGYFEESEPAVERLAQDVARQVVSAVLEAF